MRKEQSWSLAALLLSLAVPVQAQDLPARCAGRMNESGRSAAAECVTKQIMKQFELDASRRCAPTSGKTPHHVITHDLAQYARALAFPAPLYVLGIEKLAPRVPMTCEETERRQPCLPVRSFQSAIGKAQRHAGKLARKHFLGHLEGRDSRTMLLTHAAYFDHENPSSSRFLFNEYEGQHHSPSATVGAAEASEARWSLWKRGHAFLSSEGALKKHLRELVSRHRTTHLIVLSTGWNTPETESLDRYHDWMLAIGRAAKEAGVDGVGFRPLYLGLAWQSEWGKAGLPAGFARAGSVFIKGNDADEVGLIWGNLLVTNVIKPLGEELGRTREELGAPRVVLIGHSYGARVVTESALRQRLLSPDAAVTPVDVVIGLQSAFSRNRFDYKNGKGLFQTDFAPFLDWEESVRLGVFTCSDHDEPLNRYRVMAGRCSAVEKVAGRMEYPSYHFGRANQVSTEIEAGNVYFVDASAFIGDHGDVYSDAVGRLVLDAILALEQSEGDGRGPQ